MIFLLSQQLFMNKSVGRGKRLWRLPKHIGRFMFEFLRKRNIWYDTANIIYYLLSPRQYFCSADSDTAHPLFWCTGTLWLSTSVELWDAIMLGDQNACVDITVERNQDILIDVIVYLYCWLLHVIITSAVAKFHEFKVSQLIWFLL